MAALKVIRDALVALELDRRDEAYSSCDPNLRDGLANLNFLFDLVNEAYSKAGKQKPVLVLHQVESLYRMNGPSTMPQDYLDQIILRLKVSFYTLLSVLANW